jgi:glutamine synthetase
VIGEPLTGFLHCDLVGIVPGRLLAAADVEARLTSGVGWVPANISLTPFGGIAEPNPHGSTGGLRLQPDPATHVRVEFGDEVSALEFFLCDVVGTDGSPWECSQPPHHPEFLPPDDAVTMVARAQAALYLAAANR